MTRTESQGTLTFSKADDHYLLEASMVVPRPLDEVWPFFSDAANLEQLTPPWLSFRIITPQPIDMHVGTLIDYQLKVHGIALKWRTRIAEWQPPHMFVDEQLKGPYRLWHHTHTFEPVEGGTRCTDRVAYKPPFAMFSHALVKRDIQTIFEFRQQKLDKIFAG